MAIKLVISDRKVHCPYCDGKGWKMVGHGDCYKPEVCTACIKSRVVLKITRERKK